MKRLLAYLFIVLGLGLMFSVNAEANKYELQYCLYEGNSWSDVKRWKSTFKVGHEKCKIIDKRENRGLFLGITKHMRPGALNKIPREYTIDTYKLKILIAENKKEPSQTQEVAEKIEKELKRDLISFNLKDFPKDEDHANEKILAIKKQIKKLGGLPRDNAFYPRKSVYYYDSLYDLRILMTRRVAKKEPSQTQEVAEKTNEDSQKIKICFSVPAEWAEINYVSKYTLILSDLFRTISDCSILDSPNSGYKIISYEKILKKNPLMEVCIRPEQKFIFLTKTNIAIRKWKSHNKNCSEEYSDAKVLTHISNNLFSISGKTQIAKTEPTIIPEDKPEDKDIDNDAPVIEIAEAITVDSQAYTIKGKVSDKSRFSLEIDGQPIKVEKNGKFEFEGFVIDLEGEEQLKLVAIDRWNNKSEKNVKIIVELKSTTVARFYEKLKPNILKGYSDDNKVAIIIGIEKYIYLTNLDAPFANRDANAFREYASRAFGVKSSNIKLLVDSKATKPEIIEAFKLWLPRIAADGGKDIYIFFSGHGLASDDGNDLYILPQNGNSLLLEDTAITRVKLISLIQKVNPKSVTMFFDTCYSGQTREERMLIAGLKPIRIVAGKQDTPDNFTIFSASNFDQTSGTIKEAKQGMFSYYLMKGLEGKADADKDYKITNGELIAYLKTNVSKEAFTQNREQDPMLSGDPDKILMSYR